MGSVHLLDSVLDAVLDLRPSCGGIGSSNSVHLFSASLDSALLARDFAVGGM